MQVQLPYCNDVWNTLGGNAVNNLGHYIWNILITCSWTFWYCVLNIQGYSTLNIILRPSLVIFLETIFCSMITK